MTEGSRPGSAGGEFERKAQVGSAGGEYRWGAQAAGRIA